MSGCLTVIATEDELRALAAIESWQAEQKYEARRRRIKRTPSSPVAARVTPARRSSPIPSASAFSWAGVALALLLLAAGALVLGFVFLGWIVVALAQAAVGKVTRA